MEAKELQYIFLKLKREKVKTDIQILFSRMRNEVNPVKSKKFLAWAKEQYSDKDLHHILGSYVSR